MEFDPFAESYFDDPYPIYAWLREEQPTYYNERLEFWALSRYADVRSALRDTDRFVSSRGVFLDQLRSDFRGAEAQPGHILYYDPPEHTRLRRLVSGGFTPRAVPEFEANIRSAIRDLLAELRKSDSFEFVSEFSSRFPAEIVFDLLGVPEADRSLIETLVDRLLFRGDVSEDLTNDAATEAVASLTEYFTELARDRRKRPQDDMMARLVEALLPDGARLSDEELGGYGLAIVTGGEETTPKLLANGIVQFYLNPAQWMSVVADRRKVRAAVEEIGRIDSPAQYIGRHTTEPIKIHGVVIPQGSAVLLLIGAANRDEGAFDNGDTFDVDRVSDNRPLTFGYGAHACVAAHLARLEAKIALEELTEHWKSFDVDVGALHRSRTATVGGFDHVPISVEWAHKPASI